MLIKVNVSFYDVRLIINAMLGNEKYIFFHENCDES